MAWVLTAAGVAFGGLAWGIAQVQRRAATCAAHDVRAGQIAQVLGVFCGIAALALLAGAVFMAMAGGE
ncbi:MAG: hypothetical protein OHK0029_04660 [Armatimonadaceae bacterium]